MEVFIFGCDCKTAILRILPNRAVGGSRSPTSITWAQFG
jgi:hypothetical protein